MTPRPPGWGLAGAPGSGYARLRRRGALTGAFAAALGLAVACRDAAAPIEPSPVRSISVTVENTQIIVGSTTRAVAVLRDAAGNPVSDVQPVWTSLTPLVLSVSDAGVVTGLQAGTGQVRAASGTASADVTILVRNQLAATIRFARDTATLAIPGGSVQAIPAVTDDAGRPIPNPSITWSSSHPLVASVNVAGLVTAVASGAALITGSIDGLSDTLSVTVRPSPNAAAPAVTSIVPAILRPGGAYTVTGTNFGPTPGANQVLVDGMTASVQTASPTQLSIVLPTAGFTCEPARDAFLQVTANGLVGGVAATLQIANRRTLAAGQTVVVTSASDIRCNELVPAAGRWVVSIYNATRATVSPSAPAAVQFAIRGLTAPPVAAANRASAIEMLPDAGASLRQAATRPTPERARASAHEEILERNLAVLRQPTRGPAPRATRSLRAGAPIPGAPRAQLATLGAITNVKVPNLDAADFCVSNVPIGARTAFVGAHSVIVEDTTSTFNGRPTLTGQMDDYFARLGTEFESRMWPAVTEAFGNPLARDAQIGGPGKVVMVFSPRVNAMQRGNVLGFVASCDLFPASERPSSNQGAYFYAIVPMSAASGYANSETRDQWLRLLRGTVIHEVRHVTSFAERAARGLATEDASWEEGAARIAEEIYARSIYGTQARANATFAQSLACDIRYLDGTPGCADRPLLMLRHFDGLYAYLASPEIYSPLGRTFSGEVAFYAGAWSMLRWAADHFGATEGQFFREFTTSAVTGSANIETRTGRLWEESLGEWSLAMYLDDLAGYMPQAARMRFPSWNLADIWAGMCADLGPCLNPANPVQLYARSTPFFPKVRSFGNFLLGVGSMAGGGFTILDLAGPTATAQVIELKSLIGTADPPSSLRLAIARVR